MIMKRLFLVAMTLIIMLPVIAQQNSNGYAVYQYANAQQQETIDFWFTADTYIYNVRRKDFRESNDYKNRIKTLSKQDSLNFEKVIDTINKKNQALPSRYIFGNLHTNFILQNELNANLQPVCVVDTLTFVQWKVLADTLTINGLLCRKATGLYMGMQYEAWFAPSIPVAVAPLQLRGLPGLLVKLNNLTTHTQVVMTYLEWPAKNWVDAKPCNENNALTRHAFLEQQTKIEAQRNMRIRSAKTIDELRGLIQQ